MKLRDLLPELEAACDELGPDVEVVVGTDVSPHAPSPNQIVGRGRTLKSTEGRPIVTLKLGWRMETV